MSASVAGAAGTGNRAAPPSGPPAFPGRNRAGDPASFHLVCKKFGPALRCPVGPGRLAAVTPVKVDSPDFTSSDKVLAVEDSVSIYPSAAAAQAEYAAMASAKSTGCLNSVAGPALQSNMQRRASAGTTVGTVTFTSLPAGAAAQHVTGFNVAISLARSGRALTITSTEVDFVQGAQLQQVTFDGNGTACPVQLEEQLLVAAEGTH